ncbi:hypothetical protein GEMRC1_010570 [Eukaryota sp. GEM-RC1]
MGFHRDAIPDRLIPWVTPHDQNVSISDADMWTLAKFRPWHPVIRNRMPPSKHYLVKNVPFGINPSLIEQFLSGLYNRMLETRTVSLQRVPGIQDMVSPLSPLNPNSALMA